MTPAIQTHTWTFKHPGEKGITYGDVCKIVLALTCAEDLIYPSGRGVASHGSSASPIVPDLGEAAEGVIFSASHGHP